MSLQLLARIGLSVIAVLCAFHIVQTTLQLFTNVDDVHITYGSRDAIISNTKAQLHVHAENHHHAGEHVDKAHVHAPTDADTHHHTHAHSHSSNDDDNDAQVVAAAGHASNSGWSYSEQWSYVRCDLRAHINIPIPFEQYHVREQQTTCITYASQLSASDVAAIKSAELSAATNRSTDSVYLTLRHVKHTYTDAHSQSTIDVGGHIDVIHDNCHSNVSYADTDGISAAYIHRRYGPTSMEVRIIGAEMQVLPLRHVTVDQYTERHHQLLAQGAHVRPTQLGPTGQSIVYSQKQPTVTPQQRVGKFCPYNGEEDFGSARFNPVTCRFHGNDRCFYETSYAVSVTGDYDIHAYLIYVDYEGVSNVQPRLRWPRPQNALFLRTNNRHLTGTPQPWPRPKGYTDFIQYVSLPSPQTRDDPLVLPRTLFSMNDSRLSLIPMIENQFSGRWVHRSSLSAIGLQSGSVWWEMSRYELAKAYFCHVADINDYVYVPYAFDHAYRTQLYLTQRQWSYETVASRMETIRKEREKLRAEAERHNIIAGDDEVENNQLSFITKRVSSFVTPFINELTSFASSPTIPTPIFLPARDDSFAAPHDRTVPFSFIEIMKCLNRKRIAFGGDSQTRALVGHFASVLAGSQIVLKKQKWKGEIPLVWDCLTVTLSEHPNASQSIIEKQQNAAANDDAEMVSGGERPILLENQTEICYLPMSHVGHDYIYQAIKYKFNLILINSGQHPLSFEGPLRSAPRYALEMYKGINLILMKYNWEYRDKYPQENNIFIQNKLKNLSIELTNKLIWITTMPMPRALNDRYFNKNDGDGRTQDRIELGNELVSGIMQNIYNLTVFDLTESIHWPFVDCCHDFAHANEPTFHTITAELFPYIKQKLQCQ